MKRLFIRFFKSDKDEIPVDSFLVCVDNCGKTETIQSVEQQNYHIAVWMREHLCGKVDFVWL